MFPFTSSLFSGVDVPIPINPLSARYNVEVAEIVLASDQYARLLVVPVNVLQVPPSTLTIPFQADEFCPVPPRVLSNVPVVSERPTFNDEVAKSSQLVPLKYIKLPNDTPLVFTSVRLSRVVTPPLVRVDEAM